MSRILRFAIIAALPMIIRAVRNRMSARKDESTF